MPLKEGATTVTGNGTNQLRISGLAFKPLGYYMYPASGTYFSNGQTIFSGYTSDGRSATSMNSREDNYATTQAWHNFNVSGSGSNWTMTIGGNSSSVFRNGLNYTVRYWGV